MTVPVTIQEFKDRCVSLTHDEIYDLFENQIDDDLASEIYKKATPGNPEPFRSAMHNLGILDY